MVTSAYRGSRFWGSDLQGYLQTCGYVNVMLIAGEKHHACRFVVRVKGVRARSGSTFGMPLVNGCSLVFSAHTARVPMNIVKKFTAIVGLVVGIFCRCVQHTKRTFFLGVSALESLQSVPQRFVSKQRCC